MPNKHYRRGYFYEKKCIKELEGMGYYAQRSAGSHGIDINAHLQMTTEIYENIGDGIDNRPLHRAIMVTCSDSPVKIKNDSERLLSIRLPTDTSLEIWVYGNGTRRIINVRDEVSR